MKQKTEFQPQDIFLNFRDLLLYVLLRWRSILVVVLITTLLAGGYKYLKDWRAYQASAGASSDTAATDIELDADAILASTIISHDDIHYKNIANIDRLAKEMGVRDRLMFLVGGTQITPEIAVQMGADAGFGRGTKGIHDATFLVERRRELEAAGKWPK